VWLRSVVIIALCQSAVTCRLHFLPSVVQIVSR